MIPASLRASFLLDYSLALSTPCVQASDVAAQLAPLASTSVELPESDRFTLFAPSDEAFSGVVDMLPAGDALAEVCLPPAYHMIFTVAAFGHNESLQGAFVACWERQESAQVYWLYILSAMNTHT